MIDAVEAYDEVRRTLSAVVVGLPRDDLGRPVPATPGWDAADVLAHLTGNIADVAAGRWARFDPTALADDPVQAASVDAMTHRQVAERRGRPVAEIAAEWETAWQEVAPVLRGERIVEGLSPRAAGVLAVVLTSDATTHALDVLSAHERDGLRDSAAVALCFTSFAYGVGARIMRRGLAPLLVRYDGKERLLGAAEGDDRAPGATVTGSKYELTRAFSGRRSAAQIRALAWEGDVASYADLLPAYGVRDDDLVEPVR